MLSRPPPASNEDGFTIVELMASLSILAIGFFSLAGAMGLGFRQVALGRQRQTATEVANGRVEHLRNVPYEAVALTTQPVQDPDPNEPDSLVSSDGTQYDVTGDGDFEDLIVDEAGGQVLHLEDPVEVGKTVMEVWQYVTWFDQANEIKRLTVVIVYKPVAAAGRVRMVRVSSFFTRGTVTVDGTTGGATQGSGATPSPTPTPTPTGSCSGDTAGPTGDFQILSSTGQTGYTASTTVTIRMTLTDLCLPIIAQFNDGTTYSPEVTYNSENPTVTFGLTSGDGTKTVYGSVKDGLGNLRTLDSQSVILDTVKPTVPGTLTKTLSCSGTTRTVNLSWGASTDAHFSGYRLYVSTNSGSWAVLTTSSQLTFTTSHAKTLDSVRYYVAGYDDAGNESDESNLVSLSKNQCA